MNQYHSEAYDYITPAVYVLQTWGARQIHVCPSDSDTPNLPDITAICEDSRIAAVLVSNEILRQPATELRLRELYANVAQTGGFLLVFAPLNAEDNAKSLLHKICGNAHNADVWPL